MVKKPDELKDIIARYVQQLQGQFKIEKVILFGSYAAGRPGPDSDIDLAMISPDFGHDGLREVQMLCRATKGVDLMIEPLAFSAEEYRTADIQSFLGEIKKTGRVVWGET